MCVAHLCAHIASRLWSVVMHARESPAVGVHSTSARRATSGISTRLNCVCSSSWTAVKKMRSGNFSTRIPLVVWWRRRTSAQSWKEWTLRRRMKNCRRSSISSVLTVRTQHFWHVCQNCSQRRQRRNLWRKRQKFACWKMPQTQLVCFEILLALSRRYLGTCCWMKVHLIATPWKFSALKSFRAPMQCESRRTWGSNVGTWLEHVHAFTSFQLSGKGIGLEAFTCYIAYEESAGDRDSHLIDAFQAFDVDGDGSISRDEVKWVFCCFLSMHKRHYSVLCNLPPMFLTPAAAWDSNDMLSEISLQAITHGLLLMHAVAASLMHGMTWRTVSMRLPHTHPVQKACLRLQDTQLVLFWCENTQDLNTRKNIFFATNAWWRNNSSKQKKGAQLDKMLMLFFHSDTTVHFENSSKNNSKTDHTTLLFSDMWQQWSESTWTGTNWSKSATKMEMAKLITMVGLRRLHGETCHGMLAALDHVVMLVLRERWKTWDLHASSQRPFSTYLLQNFVSWWRKPPCEQRDESARQWHGCKLWTGALCGNCKLRIQRHGDYSSIWNFGDYTWKTFHTSKCWVFCFVQRGRGGRVSGQM